MCGPNTKEMPLYEIEHLTVIHVIKMNQLPTNLMSWIICTPGSRFRTSITLIYLGITSVIHVIHCILTECTYINWVEDFINRDG